MQQPNLQSTPFYIPNTDSLDLFQITETRELPIFLLHISTNLGYTL